MKLRKRLATLLLAIMMAFAPAQKVEASPLIVNPVTIECTKTGVLIVGSFLVSVGATIYEVAKIPRLPQNSEPNSYLEKVNEKGRVIQRRFYDEQGKPKVDIDLTHHGFPDKHSNPHKHLWRNGKRESAAPLTIREYRMYIEEVNQR